MIELTLKRSGNTRKAFHSTRGEASLMEDELREQNFQSRDMRKEVASQAKNHVAQGSETAVQELVVIWWVQGKAAKKNLGERTQRLGPGGPVGSCMGFGLYLGGIAATEGFSWERSDIDVGSSQLPLPWAKHCSSLTLHSHHVERGIIMCTSHLQKQGL